MLRHEGPPLYLKKLTIKNIRCFEDLSIDLGSDASPKMWGVILGDNGVGKTTLLRCIAIGLCDQASAAGLLREIYGEWNRTVDGDLKRGEIRLEFFSESDRSTVSITTYIVPTNSGYSQVKRKYKFGRSRSDFPWDRIFACGYGSARRAFGSRDIEDYATIDSVYTLFNYDTPLQNPELVLRRITGAPLENAKRGKKRIAAAKRRRIGPLLDSLSSVLMLPKGSIRLTIRGLTLSGPWGTFQPIGGLGDGFQATLAWLTDLLGWAMLYDDQRPVELVRGIVLIDEIEQHLHPRWQRQIISLLRQHFPHLQFIATTHTPMCAIGTTDLEDHECELIKLERYGNAVRAVEGIAPPRHKRADQILTSFLFELPTAGDNATVAAVARYNALRGKKALTRAERLERAQLKGSLTEEFGQSESAFESNVRKEVRKAIRAASAGSVDPEAADFEAARQVREITSREKN